MLKEFKEFAAKGNMIDMAVGIIIGAAFGTVIQSVVSDILTPIISAVFGTPDFKDLFVILSGGEGQTFATIEAAREAGAVAMGYGLFINALIAFLIVAFVLFIVVKSVNKMKSEEEAEEAPPEPTKEEELLTEIRDLLKKDQS